VPLFQQVVLAKSVEQVIERCDGHAASAVKTASTTLNQAILKIRVRLAEPTGKDMGLTHIGSPQLVSPRFPALAPWPKILFFSRLASKKRAIVSVANSRYSTNQHSKYYWGPQGEKAMKGKNCFYRPEAAQSSAARLSTMALFMRDANGELVYAPLRKKSPTELNPNSEDRRAAPRREWRQDALLWTVSLQGRLHHLNARTCELSAGGCSLLLDEAVEPGSYVDLQLGQDDESEADQANEMDEEECLPLLEIADSRPKGSIWLARCHWLQELHPSTLRHLLAMNKPRRASGTTENQPSDSWQLELWQQFHAA
jgi:hypothetical protein